MHENVLAGIEKKIGVAGIGSLLADRLSGSELSSLLLEVYRRKTDRLKPADLLAQFRQNRLVQPAPLDMIALMESSLAVLRFFRERGFLPVELSPVAALGSCSVVAAVSQDKVVSAVRGTEIVADATNALALVIAGRRRCGEEGLIRLSTVHRHVRTQAFANPRYLPHFVLGCMVSGGRDTGGYAFECEGLVEHIGSYIDLLREVYGVGREPRDTRLDHNRALAKVATEEGRVEAGPTKASDTTERSEGCERGLAGGKGEVLALPEMRYFPGNAFPAYIRLVLKRRGGYEGALMERERGDDGGRGGDDGALVDRVEGALRAHLGGVAGGREVVIEREDVPAANEYYKGLQFKLYITVNGVEWEIADGGFVDWTQRMLENRKERLLISGFGLELLFKMQNGLL
ncbi:hypothetical protein [Puia dinghuensis]|uniref:Uncharacterized protein n=1 Tax=Puia dinghuensis TaxID=1792502 RepID=A0A8J2UGY2_9BACT|nr:hypothetical protein [Puia dinghuensis]GGB15484.1 hypothetical protein GCM10011511_44100 [Puia dinghuensis]